jgi:hypothetical protein
MIQLIRSILAICAFLAPPLYAGVSHYLIIGGGPDPEASKVSMEKNAIWFEEILSQLNFSSGITLYGSENREVEDVALHATDDPTVLHWMPLARLSPDHANALTIYRNDHIDWARSGASKQTVEAAISASISQLQPGDDLFIVYSGHGSYHSDPSHNALRLWGETHVDVRDFRRLIDSAADGTVVRYVLPQCFSGAFARTIAPNPANPSLDGIKGKQCGFFAVSERVEAEGCTPGVEIGEYRDYATYFFAALTGQTRTKQPLDRNPDLNGDGRVSLREAHFYAYTEGWSSDIPRSSSDYYLELWEPWYIRWHSFVELHQDNLYLQAAKRLGEKYQLDTASPSALAHQAMQRRRQLGDKINAELARQQSLYQQAETLRKKLRYRFLLEWPNAHHPGSAAYARFITHESEAALTWIRSQPDYPKLEQLQDQVSQLDMNILELRREQAQYARIARALRLAATLENFQRLASKAQQTTYQALTACESWIPPAPRAPSAKVVTSTEVDPS